jgi:hypothetical protein
MTANTGLVSYPLLALFRCLITGGNAGDMQFPAQCCSQSDLAAEGLGFIRDQLGRIDIIGIEPRDTIAAKVK